MTRRTKVWKVVSLGFTVLNLVGAVYAAVLGEWLHAGVHVALTFAGVYWASRVWGSASEPVMAHDGLTDRLTHLEESMDAVAIEVERVGEGQRFMNQLFVERDKAKDAEVRRSGALDRNESDVQLPGGA